MSFPSLLRWRSETSECALKQTKLAKDLTRLHYSAPPMLRFVCLLYSLVLAVAQNAPPECKGVLEFHTLEFTGIDAQKKSSLVLNGAKIQGRRPSSPQNMNNLAIFDRRRAKGGNHTVIQSFGLKNRFLLVVDDNRTAVPKPYDNGGVFIFTFQRPIHQIIRMNFGSTRGGRVVARMRQSRRKRSANLPTKRGRPSAFRPTNWYRIRRLRVRFPRAAAISSLRYSTCSPRSKAGPSEEPKPKVKVTGPKPKIEVPAPKPKMETCATKNCAGGRKCCGDLECRVAGPTRESLCLPECAKEGEECFFGHNCCDGMRCRFSPDAGSTVCQPSCSKPGDLCFADECCLGFQCKDNTCVQCAMDGGRCGDGVECCDATSWCAFSEKKGFNKCHFR